jgi:hypothetical protein
VPDIKPKRARLALATGLRKLADAVENGDVHWIAAVGVYTQQAAETKGRAFDQLSGFPDSSSGVPFWMVATGALRSAYLDFESQLMDAGAQTVRNYESYTD